MANLHPTRSPKPHLLQFIGRQVVKVCRRVAPVLTRLLPGRNGRITRLRAKHAWTDWDETEIERELNSWKNLNDWPARMHHPNPGPQSN